MASTKLPLWLRALLVVVAFILAGAAGLFGYRYYTHPTTLTVAVGSIDGEAAKASPPLPAIWSPSTRP